MTWKLLSEAFEHVLQHERDRYVSERLLLLALYDGRVRARGYAVSAYGEDVVEPLDRNCFKTDEEAHVETRLNIEANSLRHVDGWRDIAAVTFYRLELSWEDLIASWPKRRDCEQQVDHNNNDAKAVARKFLTNVMQADPNNTSKKKRDDLLKECQKLCPISRRRFRPIWDDVATYAYKRPGRR
jgi:hypothetical protein